MSVQLEAMAFIYSLASERMCWSLVWAWGKDSWMWIIDTSSRLVSFNQLGGLFLR